MDANELKDTIASLQHELSHGKQLDEESRERLRVLLDDIHEVLHPDSTSCSTSGTQGDSLGDRLQDAVVDFEAAHPQFSQLIGRIADGLSNLGI